MGGKKAGEVDNRGLAGHKYSPAKFSPFLCPPTVPVGLSAPARVGKKALPATNRPLRPTWCVVYLLIPVNSPLPTHLFHAHPSLPYFLPRPGDACDLSGSFGMGPRGDSFWSGQLFGVFAGRAAPRMELGEQSTSPESDLSPPVIQLTHLVVGGARTCFPRQLKLLRACSYILVASLFPFPTSNGVLPSSSQQ